MIQVVHTKVEATQGEGIQQTRWEPSIEMLDNQRRPQSGHNVKTSGTVNARQVLPHLQHVFISPILPTDHSFCRPLQHIGDDKVLYALRIFRNYYERYEMEASTSSSLHKGARTDILGLSLSLIREFL